MVDYANLAAVALRLIQANGRAVSLRKVTTGAPGDSAKPWVPGAEATADTTATGVFLDTQRSFITGELIPTDESVLLLSASELGALVPINKDRIVDGSDVWEVTKVDTLEPGDTALLYELRIKK